MYRNTRTEIGFLGESIACQFLERKGFFILDRNFRRPWGEIDIIAQKDGAIRFVEVKTFSGNLDLLSRESNTYRPEEQIHSAKLRKIARTAQIYMANRGDDKEYQIDAVGVILDQRTRKARCRLFEQIL